MHKSMDYFMVVVKELQKMGDLISVYYIATRVKVRQNTAENRDSATKIGRT